MPTLLDDRSSAKSRWTIPGLRWWIVGLLFIASVKNYVDRQTLSILAPTIQRVLRVDDTAYARILNLFLIAYTISYLASGRITDWLGTRLSMALFMGWWSLASMLTAFARSAASLGCFRFMLGLGEAGNYTVAPKVVAEWFPPKERAVAMGMNTLGATIGATIAPLLVVAILHRYGWQAAFAVTGAVGFVWLLPWIWLYRRPREHPRLSGEEREIVLGEAEAAKVEEEPEVKEPELARWGSLLRRRDVWLLLVGRMLTDPVFYFFQFWFAKYLFSVRHVPQSKLGITWVVFLAADVGSLGGGFLSGYLIQRGRTPAGGRVAAMFLCACLIPLAPLAAFAPSLAGCLAIAMVVVVAHMSWLVNISALVVDLIPKRVVATAFGLIAAGSTVGGIMMNSLVAKLVTRYSYTDWFVIMAFLHPVAWLILWGGRVHRPPHTPGLSAPDSERVM